MSTDHELVDAMIRKAITYENDLYVMGRRPRFGKNRKRRWDRSIEAWEQSTGCLAEELGIALSNVEEAFGETYGRELNYDKAPEIKAHLLELAFLVAAITRWNAELS